MRRLIGVRTGWPEASAQDLVIDADGDSHSFTAPPCGGALITMTFRNATVAPLMIHFTNWHDGWAEFCATRDHVNGDVDPDEHCWHGRCIASSHPRSAQHVDATGVSWVQPRREG